jgi:3'-5' exonuclease
MKNLVVFDIETALDTEAVCRGLRLGAHDPRIAHEHIGEEFPKLPFHRVIAIGRLEAFFGDNAWQVGQIACDHIGEMEEFEMLGNFDERIAMLKPTLCGFNIKGFDLVVIRYRSMMHHMAMRGLSSRNYLARYKDDCQDIADILANHDARGKVSLDLLSRVLELPGKPDDVDGSKLGLLIEAGEFKKIASYCEQDVVLTYLVWLRYQLYMANLSPKTYQASLNSLDHFIVTQKPSLAHLRPRAS